MTVAVALVLFVAAGLRLNGVGWGLPAMLDPDEPMFILTGFKLLREQTLNPGWFGHPGTLTIYLVALTEAAVIALGLVTGRWADVAGFGRAFYFDPSIVLLPARLVFVACGVIAVWVTWRLGRDLLGPRQGLAAALLTALAPLHIEYSQVVRTDVLSGLFMLAGALAAVRAAASGRLRDFMLIGVATGLAAATKWPAAMIGIAIFAVAAHRLNAGDDPFRRAVRLAATGATTSVVTLCLASPYLILDYRTALANVSGEAAAGHLGATGAGFLANLAWYFSHPLRDTLGLVGLGLAVVGIAAVAVRPTIGRTILISVTAAVLLVLGRQSLIFPRWIVPLVPFMALFAAAGLAECSRRLVQLGGIRVAGAGAGALAFFAAAPLLATDLTEARERNSETRVLAARWARQHIPPGSSVVIEHFALDLVQQPWAFLFPVGALGCIDAKQALSGQIKVATVQQVRGKHALVDLGTVAPGKLDSCRAEYAIVSHFDRYLAERAVFPAEVASYRSLVAGGQLVARFAPVAGVSTGPIVRVYRLSGSQAVR